VVREGVGAGGRNEPSLVCTYNKRKMRKKNNECPQTVTETEFIQPHMY
jgi:hypothetical protein